MKTLACQDMGVACDYVAKAESEDEVIKMAMEHAKSAHTDEVEKMMAEMSEEQMAQELKAKIKEM